MSTTPSNENPHQMKVVLFNREYRVSCPENQEEKLVAAAEFLNQRTRETQDSNAGIGADQTIAITALNLAHELLEQREGQQHEQRKTEQTLLQQRDENDKVRERLEAIKERLDTNTFQRRMRSGQLHQF